MNPHEQNNGRGGNGQGGVNRQVVGDGKPSTTMKNTYYGIEPQLVSEKNSDTVNKVGFFNVVENPYYD